MSPGVSEQPSSSTTAPWPCVPGFTLIRVLGQGGCAIVLRGVAANAPEIRRPQDARGYRAVLRGDAPAPHARGPHDGGAATPPSDPNLRVRGCEGPAVHRDGAAPRRHPHATTGQCAGSWTRRRDGGTARPRASLRARRDARGGDGASRSEALQRSLPGERRRRAGDLGVGRHLEDTRLTLPGHVVGTIGYLPPEVLLEGRAHDARADLFGLGVTLYQALAGVHPTDYSPIPKDMPAPDPRRSDPSCSEALCNTIRALMELDPAEPSPVGASRPRDSRGCAGSLVRRSAARPVR